MSISRILILLGLGVVLGVVLWVIDGRYVSGPGWLLVGVLIALLGWAPLWVTGLRRRKHQHGPDESPRDWK